LERTSPRRSIELDFSKTLINLILMSDTIKLLFVDTGTVPLTLEKQEFPALVASPIRETILAGLNKYGKLSHVLIKHNGKYWTARHESGKGPSKDYVKEETTYHPHMKELN
jgi:hypothetical protein